MIVYDLKCDTGHRFEGWFGSSTDFDDQSEKGLVSCPQCGSGQITKAVMAPAIPAKGNRTKTSEPSLPAEGEKTVHSNTPVPPEVAKAMKALAEAQSKSLKDSTWVGDKFADQSRAMHYGEKPETAIHGQASAKEAKDLLDEGIAVAPLPFPVTPPEETN